MTGCHDTTASASRDVRTANASQIRATQYFSRITITMGSFEVLESGEGGINARPRKDAQNDTPLPWHTNSICGQIVMIVYIASLVPFIYQTHLYTDH